MHSQSPSNREARNPVEELVTDTQISLEVSKGNLGKIRSKGFNEPAAKAEKHVDQALRILNDEIQPSQAPSGIERMNQWFRNASNSDRNQFIKLASALPKGDPDRRKLLKMAMEFDSEDALKKYLEEHPGADKSLHSVKKTEDKGKSHDEEDEDFGNLEVKFNKFLGKLKGLGSKSMEALKKAPAKVQAFVSDPEERKKVLTSAADTIKKSPAALAKGAVKAAKDLGHEYKTAGKAVGKVFRGEDLDKHDKKAMFAVGVSMAAVVLAGATGGTAVAAGTFGKGVARHIAATAVHAALGELNILGEAGEIALHLGEGALHMMSGGAPGGHHASSKSGAKGAKKIPSEGDQMNGFANLVMAKTHDSLKKGMDEESLMKVLKEEEPEGAEKYEKKAREAPLSKMDQIRRLRDLSTWGGARGGIRVFDLPLKDNPTRYSLVKDERAGGWWATVRSPEGRGRGERLFIEPGGETVSSVHLATPHSSDRMALGSVAEHAEKAIAQFGLEEPEAQSLWTKWFGRTAERKALVRLASTLEPGSEERRVILRMAQVFPSAFDIGDPVWVSSQGQALAGNVRAVSFSSSKVRYSVQVDGSTFRGVDSILVTARPEGIKLEYGSDNEM